MSSRPPRPVLTLPSRLQRVLETNAGLLAGVTHLFGRVAPWLHASRLSFFPEYTDHGVSHLAQVLYACDQLVDDDGLSLLTASDVAVLAAAVVLHDLAMHLEKDGFLRLVSADSEYAPIAHFGDTPWPRLWEEFRLEATRFGTDTNRLLFGTTEPVTPPSADTTDWTENQFRLVGEFIRRHHARLAHEIALHGFPTPSGAPTVLLHDPSLGPLMDAAGTVARSHGMSMRPCLAYLGEASRSPGLSAAAYLMALLRIGDYLQLEADRAESMMLRVRTLRSPISRDEWRKHQAVVRLHYEARDPEAVHVTLAPPPDVQTYLGIVSTLTGLQAELDSTWAVLGETYGRDERYQRLRLRVRRVRSDIDTAGFTARLPYLPVEARFRAADASLLSLLVGPLYGGRAEFGVREMVQNAVDAVRELEAWCARRGLERTAVPLTDQPGDVVVALEDEGESGTLTISDRGIGMTPATLRDFFLNAGASFRVSAAWVREFGGADGHSTVVRSGRFGVGSLAAFLLGEEVHVSTRHVSESEGVEFSATLGRGLIQFTRCDRPVGTTLRIPLSPQALTRLRREEAWDFYCLQHPSVVRSVRESGQVRTLPQSRTLAFDDTVAPTWRLVRVERGLTVFWDGRETGPHACNGLLIGTPGEMRAPYVERDQREPVVHRLPQVSVRDIDGVLPLNLARTDVNWGAWGSMPQLRRDIALDFLAFTLLAAPEHPFSKSSDANAYLRTSTYRMLEGVHGALWVSTQEGITLLGPWFFEQLEVRRLAVLFCEGNYPRASSEVTGGWNPAAPYAIVAIPPRSDGMHPGEADWVEGLGLRAAGTRKLTADVRDYGARWSVEEHRRVSDASLDFERLSRSMPDAFDIIGGTPLVEHYLTKLKGVRAGPLAEAWDEHFGTACVPYEAGVRRRTLARAHRQLAPYLDRWKRLLDAGWLSV